MASAQVIAVLVPVVRWLARYGLLTCLGFAWVLSYVTIIFGRWLFGRNGL